MPPKKTIVFFHPDLGIGGAERLVVDAAVGLQNLDHKVVIFTSHCDPNHCFEEARDGTLDVRVRGNTLVPPNILGRFSILCAILRQVHLVLQIALSSSELRDLQPNVFFVDQLSASVPLLRLASPAARIIFYCHFPDKLLAQRAGWYKSVYRIPFDWLEQWTTGISDRIVVNSKFTRGVFADAFPRLRNRQPGVVYPCVDVDSEAAKAEGAQGAKASREQLWKGKKIILSINRFERKKDIALAINAFSGLDPLKRKDVRLVVAGGYDPRVGENVQYHKELEQLSERTGLRHATTKNMVTAMSVPENIEVLFLLSIPTSFKTILLQNARLLAYTPLFEHFGIVPLEAMLACLPVLAADQGGPTETVVDGETGWLRSVKQVKEWTKVMEMAVGGLPDETLHVMGRRGQKRVREQFSQQKMAQRLEQEIQTMCDSLQRPSMVSGTFLLGFLGAITVGLVAMTVAVRTMYIK